MPPVKPTASNPDTDKKPKRVIFYPQPHTFLFPLVMFANSMISIGNLLRDLSKHGNRGGYWLIGFITLMFMLLIALLYSFFLRCGSVDEKGIHWRDRKAKHLTRWSEITDFYQVIGSGYAVKTERDTITLRFDLAHGEKVRDFIAARCGARLGLDEWGFYGLRPQDLPQTFDYPEKPNAQKLRLGRVLLFPAFVLLGGLVVVPRLVSVNDGLFMIDIALLALSLSLGLAGLSLMRTAIAARGRAGQRFIAQTDGFTFDTGREAVTVAWGDVIGYDFDPQATRKRARLFPPLDVLRLRTEQGQEFHFLAAIDRVELWKETVRRSAVNGVETKIDAERAQALGGVPRCWSGGVEGVGDRVFHARTRNNLFPMILLGAFGVLPVALVIADIVGWISLPLATFALPLLIAVGLESALIVVYYTRRVVIGADGISYVLAWRRQDLLWREVADWKADFRGIRIDSTDGTSIRFKPSELAYGSRIAPLIEEHLRGAGVTTAGVNATPAKASDAPSAAALSATDK